MDTTLIVIIVLVIAALIALGIHLNERRKKRNKAKHAASKKAHPASTITSLPVEKIAAKLPAGERIPSSSIKTTLDSNGHHAVNETYVAPTFRKETPKPRTTSTPKAESYKSRYNDSYYPSNNLTDAVLLAAIINSQSVDETEQILRDHVGIENPEPAAATYEEPTSPYSSSYDSGSNGSYSNSYDSNGSSGGYSSYESSGSSPSYSSSDSSSSYSSSSSDSSSSSSYSSDSGSSSFSFD